MKKLIKGTAQFAIAYKLEDFFKATVALLAYVNKKSSLSYYNFMQYGETFKIINIMHNVLKGKNSVQAS